VPRIPLFERQQIARARLVRVLRRHGIATWRTLEQKIADAGPGPMRVDPHILTPVRKELEAEGVIDRRAVSAGTWFWVRSTPPATVEARLAVQEPIYRALQRENFKLRMGQTLEIAIYRALSAQNSMPDWFGHFLDLNEHDDSTLYSKEEPPRQLGSRNIGGNRRLDFLVRHPDAGWAGLEAKNIREWLYPDRREIFDLLSKCIALDVVPVLIARRIHFSSFVVLHACGVIMHQTFNQLFPLTDTELANSAKHKDNLGYHDIRVGNSPDVRLSTFITENLLAALPEARQRFDEYYDLISGFVHNEMDYSEFAARVRRRRQGRNEDNDWDDNAEIEPIPPDDIC
jgi:hypothetical protein